MDVERRWSAMIAAGTLLLTGCASIWTYGVQTAPTAGRHPLGKVLVVSEEPTSWMRARWEEEVAADLAAYGVSATPATRRFAGGPPDAEALARVSSEFDDVIIIHQERAERRTGQADVGGATSATWLNSTYGYFGTAIEMTSLTGDPHLLVSTRVEVVPAIAGGEPIWTGDIAWLYPRDGVGALNPPSVLVRALARRKVVVPQHGAVSLHPTDSW